MRDVKILKQLPWVILFLLFAAGISLWLLFVAEQQSHTQSGFRNQLERLGDELLRNRLEGRLDLTELPEGIIAFALYDARGAQVAAWGDEAPGRLDPLEEPWRKGLIRGVNDDGNWVGLFRALQPLAPRIGLDSDDWDDRETRPRPMMGRRNQGFVYVSVGSDPLDGRLVAWTAAGLLGSAAWAGFVVFVGVLWFRTRRYQAALTQNRELLQFAEASRTLGHELQNPLAAILLQTALLKRSAAGEVPAEVAIIEEEAQRMSGLVARVRDFLKDPKGQAEVLDLAVLVDTLKGRFAVPVAVVQEGAAPFGVAFDPYRLRSVVENLVKNAVESGPEPRPEVRLSRPRAGWVRLEVVDSGGGFTADSLKNALNPFFTTKTTGTGIGLSIADSFVRAAGGRLKLENRPEGGARVILDLPEAPREAAP